jgi:hypothetical protein
MVNLNKLNKKIIYENMWYKKHEIKNTGKGYIIVFCHYETDSRFDGCGQPYKYELRDGVKFKKYVSNEIHNIDGFYKYTVEEIGLKYYIPHEDNYLYNGFIHFQCVNDCKKFIDEISSSNRNMKNNIKENYSEIYDFNLNHYNKIDKLKKEEPKKESKLIKILKIIFD